MTNENEVDKRHRARTSSANLRKAALDEAIELGPQLIGALEGLATEIRELRTINDRMLHTLERLDSTCRGLTDELAALRELRAKGGNGYAPNDNLTEGDR